MLWVARIVVRLTHDAREARGLMGKSWADPTSLLHLDEKILPWAAQTGKSRLDCRHFPDSRLPGGVPRHARGQFICLRQGIADQPDGLSLFYCLQFRLMA